MFKFLISIAALFLGLNLIGQNGLKKENDVLLTVGESEFKAEEFVYLYDKNNGSDYVTEKLSVDEYLDLYINYKLKVKAAEKAGLSNDPKFLKEYNKYIKMLTDPYLSDAEADSAILREAYERMKYEVRSSHIQVKIPEDASPSDTLTAYKRAMRIRSRLLKGEDFATVAKMTSDDNSAKTNGGDIGYISVFQAVYPYESFIFNNEVGKISMPFRTQWGYHVVKVTDKKKVKEDCKLQHIMVAISSEDELAAAQETMDSVYEQLQNGVDFGELSEKFSTDEAIRKKRGNMGWISYSQIERNYRERYPLEFMEKAFETKSGEYTKPFTTKWGVHIVKVLDKRPIASFEQLEPVIKQKISQFPDRSKLSKIALVDKLRSKYKPEINHKKFTELAESVFDSNLVDGKWSIAAEMPEDIVLKIGDKAFPFKNYAEYVVKHQRPQKRLRNLLAYANLTFEDYINSQLIDLERKSVLSTNDAVKYLAYEYYDGMLLFTISDSLIWTRANKDTTGLEAFYESVKNNYLWDERVLIAEYSCEEELDTEFVEKLVLKGQKKGWGASKISDIYKKKKGHDLIITESKNEKGVYPNVDDIGWDSRAVIATENARVIEIKGVVAKEPKLLSEIRGEVISKYQEHLEKEWVETLRKEFDFKVNEKVLAEIQSKY